VVPAWDDIEDVDPWEEDEGIAIRTATLTAVGGELELSSVNEILLEFEWAFIPLSAVDEAGRVELGKSENILAPNEGVAPVR